MNQKATDQEASMLLTVFSFEDALFAVDAMRVQEIIRVGPITPVHHAPPHVLGIINLRGRIVTVLDPACRMGLETQERTADSRILIVDWRDEQIGLLVSRIHDMVNTEREDLAPVPPNLKQHLGTFLAGVVKHKEHMVSVLDLEPLLAVEELT